MNYLYQLLVILHVMFSMTWFGSTLTLPRTLRQIAACDPACAKAQVAGLQRSGTMAAGAGFLVLLSGVGLAFMFPGGFGSLPVRYHIALGLTLAWNILGGVGVGPTLRKFAEGVGAGHNAEQLKPLVKQASMLGGIMHMLFTLVLVLMLWRI
jgi:hypothetical protein